MKENPSFLKEQIITYLGNKRALLGFLNKGFKVAKKELGKDKFSFCDIFSGSGVVSRFAKAHSNYILANDLENYSKLINKCYLSNKDKNLTELLKHYHKILTQNLEFQAGFISELYAPKDDDDIKKNERVFYTFKNALYLDTLRQKIEKEIPEELKHFFIAPLIYEASVHSNTSGVFKGFYKGRDGVGKFGGEAQNALKRIKGDIELKMPIFSNFSCEFEVVQKDANLLAKELENIDVAYLDPPYNQHPYSSNYFMLNLIANYQRPDEISKISGIPRDWNRSIFNKEKQAEDALFELINDLKAKIILLSYNCEGFVKKEKFLKRLQSLGKCQILEQKYPTFRASRNLKNRSIHIHEQLYILKKNI
ncbi:DNA modification methylase [Campylobacter coli]|uniref:site-specific DNA-methyltransferase (adenine-specific) n=1 Tax=Campylobacter coli TaxID=195 RepID=A0A693QDL1_CAMCO|nr:DNA adenine methylase [Campylobacter coli]EAC2153935.1 DNA modification methylase [Campylobacter coli]EAH4797518.1 DNA modification methylase [Campylobacter coli]EAH4950400.1 DNA modification methylase [Campylobacter coli]EAH4974406.1 DNA modification methylase [Campylobacter coli]EAH6753952.1 DNA modification methylase [Campylobacter coli]